MMYKLTVIAVLLCLVTSLHSLIQHSVILKKHNSISNHRIYSSNTPNADTSSSVASSFARDDDDVKIDFDELAAESAAAAFVTKTDISDMIVTEPRRAPRQAQWFPMLLSPTALDGKYAGDVGFDPLGLAKDKETLEYMREAEVKHCRLAMLGAAGWPLEELWHDNLAEYFQLDSILAAEGKAPSLLNGGLDNSFILSAGIMAMVFGGILEYIGSQAAERSGYTAGNLGFDPLKLHSFRTSFGIDRIDERLTREEKIARGKFDMELCEIKNGRAAMIAITLMALQEYITNIPVVQYSSWAFGSQIS